MAIGCHLPENDKNIIDFLRCEDGGWFVEDEQRRAAIECL